MTRRRSLSDERGQASVEFAGVLFWLVLTAFVVWQLLLVTWTFNQASNAARTRCARVVPRVIPVIVPLASGSQYGVPIPTKAGTR